MKRLAVVLCLLLCLPLTARADDATKRAKVQEMLDLLHLDRTLDQLMNIMKQQAIAASNAKLNQEHASGEQKARADAFQSKLFDFIQSNLSWKAMEPDYVKLYAENFTEEEIDAMTAFYKSPAGVSMIAKTPELTRQSTALAQKKMLDLLPQIQQMIQDYASTAGKHDGSSLNSN
jgi:hypothetical protein